MCSRGQFMSTDTGTGFVKVCSLQIKQMFIVVICVQKNKHSSNPLSTPLTEQSVFVGLLCTLNYAYLPHIQWYPLSAQRSLRRTRHLSHTLSLPRQRGQPEIRSSVLCSFSSSFFTKTNTNRNPGPALFQHEKQCT